jgi:hypothetical protein
VNQALSEPIRTRIAMLAFGEPGGLSPVVDVLLRNGFDAGQFCLLGQPSALGALRRPHPRDAATDETVEALISSTPVYLKLSQDSDCEMRCGGAACRLFDRSQTDLVLASWLRPDLTATIRADIETGCLILLVDSQSAQQHALGARLLLRHGQNNLLTLEFTAPSRSD